MTSLVDNLQSVVLILLAVGAIRLQRRVAALEREVLR
jgi:hypothetical protein